MGNIKVSQLQEQTTLNDNGYFYYVNGSEKSRKVSLQTMRAAFGGGGQALDMTNAVSGVVDIPSFPAYSTNIGYVCKQITNGTEPSNFVFAITDIGVSNFYQARNYLVGVFAIVDSEGEDASRNKVGITTNDVTQEAGKTYWEIKSDRSLEQITGDGSTAIVYGKMCDRAEPMILQSLFQLNYNSTGDTAYTYVTEIDDSSIVSTSLGGWRPYPEQTLKVYGSNLNVHKNNSSVVWSKNTKLCIACWSTTNNWNSPTIPTAKIKYLKIPVV